MFKPEEPDLNKKILPVEDKLDYILGTGKFAGREVEYPPAMTFLDLKR